MSLKNSGMIMRYLQCLLPLFALLLLAGCSSNGNSQDTIVYKWPVWSPDNVYVVAQYARNPQSQGANAPVGFLIRNTTNNSGTIVQIPLIDPSAPYRQWVAPDSNFIVLGNNGLRVADFDGIIRNDEIQSASGILPQCIAFSHYQTAYFWAGSANGRVLVSYVATYNPSTLEPVGETTILDTAVTAAVDDIVETREGNCAILLSTGELLTISIENGTTSRFDLETTPAITGGTERIRYMRSSTGNPNPFSPDFLYYLDAEGLGRINLVTDETMNLISSDAGNISNFDVDGNARSVLFVTSGKQVWLASENGTLIQTLMYEHSMASFSPDGKSVAAVGYLNGLQTSLTILRIRP